MCGLKYCPQWEFRLGSNPFRKRASDAQRAQGRKLGARMRRKSADALNPKWFQERSACGGYRSRGREPGDENPFTRNARRRR
jgi:hypothetical protein